MTYDLEALRKAHGEALADLAEATQARNNAIQSVKDFHAPKIEYHEKHLQKLCDELTAAEAEQAPAHPWEGQIVTRTKDVYNGHGWNRTLVRKTILRGVVMTWRLQTGLKPYREWDPLKIGDPIVVLLKTDGQPGKKWERFGRDWELETPVPSGDA